MEFPIREVVVPHKYHIDGEGEAIPINFLLPPGAGPQKTCPLVMIMTGLDGYRTELAVWQRGWLDKGVATVVVEIPGTGDSPAAKSDPEAADRQWSSVLKWIRSQTEIDHKKIVVWGFSTGGYYALRAAHTHADRLLACVSLGGGAHHMFDKEWLEHANHLEYPFDLADTLAYKFGCPNWQSLASQAKRYSLLEDGTLNKRCCKVLLVNGTDDEIFPIEDMWVALQNGMPKEARMVKGKKHMGEPESFVIILKWIHELLGVDGDVMSQIKQLPMRCKY